MVTSPGACRVQIGRSWQWEHLKLLFSCQHCGNNWVRSIKFSGYFLNTVAQSYQSNLAPSLLSFPLGLESQHPSNPPRRHPDLEDLQHNIYWSWPLLLSGLLNSSLAKPALPQHPPHSRFCVYTKTHIVKHTGKNEDSSFWTWLSSLVKIMIMVTNQECLKSHKYNEE